MDSKIELKCRGGWYSLHVRGGRGPGSRVSLRTQDRAVAEAKLAEARAAEQVKEAAAGGRERLPDVVEDYLELEWARLRASSKGHLAHSTLAVRERQLRKVVRILGAVPMHELGRHLGVWRDAMRKDGRSDKTLSNYLDGLRDVAKHWRSRLRERDPEGELPPNPVEVWIAAQREGTERERPGAKSAQEDRDIQALTPEQSARLLAAAEKLFRAKLPATYGLILMAHDAGLRGGELAAISWEDVHFGAGREDRSRHLYVRRNSPANGAVLEAPKTVDSKRRVHLSWRLREWLREERAHRRLAGWSEPTGPIFGRYDRTSVLRSLARAARLAEVPVVTLLELRHTYASQLFSAGWDLGYVSRQMGNSPDVCKAHYARYFDAEGFVEPARLAPWELPADLLARSSAAAQEVAQTA